MQIVCIPGFFYFRGTSPGSLALYLAAAQDGVEGRETQEIKRLRVSLKWFRPAVELADQPQKKETKVMEFLTGVKQKEVLEIGDLLLPEMVGREVKVNGAVHAIRDMGTIAFVILRKREGAGAVCV